MDRMDRRAFVRTTAVGVGAAVGRLPLRAAGAAEPASGQPVTGKVLRAADVAALGNTGIKPSRLAIGTGSNGAEQRGLGVQGLARLLQYAFDRGITWWETADLYQTHPHVRAALRKLPRERVVITSKVLTCHENGVAKTPAEVRRDVGRIRKELDADYIDILLMHCMSQPDWPEKMKGPMEVLDEAKEKGRVRAVGCSLHVLSAVEAAAKAPWGDVFLVRINPFAVNMDVQRPEEVPKLEKALTALHHRTGAVYGMKLFGGTDPHRRQCRLTGGQLDQSLRFALSRPYLAGFTVGFSRERDLDDVIRRIEQVRQSRT